jgi:hydroxyacyl-ACP dehydratase HTD2-like protein with hotdog domain
LRPLISVEYLLTCFPKSRPHKVRKFSYRFTQPIRRIFR